MKINGIKLGFENRRISQRYIPESCDSPIYKILSEQGNNISLMNIDGTLDEVYISCCFAPAFSTQPGNTTGENKPVVTVSLFPHHGNLDILGILLDFLSRSHYPVYDFSTSNATLTFVTDYKFCLEICKELAEQFELPSSHTPFLPIPQSLDNTLFKTAWPETSAAYVEKKIKTYGFNIKKNLDLYCIQTEFKSFSKIRDHNTGNNKQTDKFHFTSGYMTQNGQIRLFCVFDHNPDAVPWSVFSNEKIRVDLVSFQGPHFGDRYGIANKAMSLLAASKTHVLLAGFTGACIYLVFPENSAEKSVHSLLKGFTRP